MKQPGVEVRPIKQIDGSAEFNEVFFTERPLPARATSSAGTTTAGRWP